MGLEPGYDINITDRGQAAVAPGDVSTLLATVITEQGPANTPVESGSYAQWEKVFGSSIDDSHAARCVRAFFAEGGTRVISSRVVGPDPSTGGLTLSNSSPASVITLSSLNYDLTSDKFHVTVAAATGNDRTVTFGHDDLGIFFSQTFTSKASLTAAFLATEVVDAVMEAGAWPIVVSSKTYFSEGDPDIGNITQTELSTAMRAIEPDLGGGLLVAPGITTPAMHTAMLEFAAECEDRFALLDSINTGTISTLEGQTTPLRALGKTAGFGMLVAPWETVTDSGVEVQIPPAASVAGRMSLVDRTAEKGPGEPAGGDNAPSRWSVGVAREFTAAEREALHLAGINVVRVINGQVQLYGYRTLADPTDWPQYVEANGMRVLNAVVSELKPLVSSYVIKAIDGNGHLLANLDGSTVALLKGWYDRGALYGATAQQAFKIDTGPEINPIEELRQRRVTVAGELATVPFVERVTFNITKVAAGAVN